MEKSDKVIEGTPDAEMTEDFMRGEGLRGGLRMLRNEDGEPSGLLSFKWQVTTSPLPVEEVRASIFFLNETESNVIEPGKMKDYFKKLLIHH